MRMLILAVVLGLSGCATIVTTPIPDCDRYIPPSMRARVPGVELPVPSQHSDGHQDALPWQEGFLGQTGQVEKANDRGDGMQHIYSTCLQLHREAQKRDTRRKFLGLF